MSATAGGRCSCPSTVWPQNYKMVYVPVSEKRKVQPRETGEYAQHKVKKIN